MLISNDARSIGMEARATPLRIWSGVLQKVLRLVLFCGVLLISSCSKHERSEVDEAEWAEIQPITNAAVVATNQSRRVVQSGGEDYLPLFRR
ncbi:MAG: hypothetical protein DRP64_20795 [Verrucomicrobia bacterium]|nr:MAG: hypothetical protein DRP64_20795 [Verrucomicrobiota bacterium]